MNILTLTKGLATTAASLGVGTVVGNVVTATTPEKVSTVQKVVIGIGGLALTSLVGEAVSRRTETKIDELSETFGYPKDAEVEISVEEN